MPTDRGNGQSRNAAAVLCNSARSIDRVIVLEARIVRNEDRSRRGRENVRRHVRQRWRHGPKRRVHEPLISGRKARPVRADGPCEILGQKCRRDRQCGYLAEMSAATTERFHIGLTLACKLSVRSGCVEYKTRDPFPTMLRHVAAACVLRAIGLKSEPSDRDFGQKSLRVFHKGFPSRFIPQGFSIIILCKFYPPSVVFIMVSLRVFTSGFSMS
jgi:hypothetical protein